MEREEKKALGCEKIKGSQQVVEFMNSGLGEVWRGTASRHTLRTGIVDRAGTGAERARKDERNPDQAVDK